MAVYNRRAFIKSGIKSSLIAGTAVTSLHPFAFAAPKRKGWIELFDGKSLQGWHINPEKIGHGTGGQWEVENGVIAGQQDPPGSGNGGILMTDRKFESFVLEIDMKPDWGVCSGLFLRGNDRGKCFQMMVDYHDAGNVGHIYGEGTTGFNTRAFDINGKYDDEKKLIGITTDKHKNARECGLEYTCTPEAWVKAWKLNGWNTARVEVSGKYPQINTFINGLKVANLTVKPVMPPITTKRKFTIYSVHPAVSRYRSTVVPAGQMVPNAVGKTFALNRCNHSFFTRTLIANS